MYKINDSFALLSVLTTCDTVYGDHFPHTLLAKMTAITQTLWHCTVSMVPIMVCARVQFFCFAILCFIYIFFVFVFYSRLCAHIRFTTFFKGFVVLQTNCIETNSANGFSHFDCSVCIHYVDAVCALNVSHVHYYTACVVCRWQHNVCFVNVAKTLH